jgi:hypothetical protein
MLARRMRLAVTSAAATTLLASTLLAAGSAGAAVTQTQLVPSTPATGYPVINVDPVRADGTNRAVLAANQVGDYVVAGGDFLTVTPPGTTTALAQPYLTGWNLTTKQVLCPGLKPDDEVLDIVPGPTPNTAIIAGRFNKITMPNGTVINNLYHIATLRVTDCTLVPTFVTPVIVGKVNALAVHGNRLFIGGDFDTVGGRAIPTIAELNATTGALNTSFVVSSSGGLTTRVRALGVNTAGTRLVVAGRFGTLRVGARSVTSMTAVLDVRAAAPVLTPHSSTGYLSTRNLPLPLDHLTAAAVSPDGTLVGLTFGLSSTDDYVYVTPTVELANMKYRWRHYMRDTAFGIAFSHAAVYVTGHFCKPDGGPSASDIMAPSPGIPTDCTGAALPGGVWRGHLAALSLRDGTPLTWNPGNGSFKGGTEITVVPRGLLVGYDGRRTGDQVVGGLTFFDLGA